MKNDNSKYSYRTMWILITIWSILSVWTWYIAYEYLHWDGGLWFVLLVTYIAVLFPIIAYSDIEW